MDGANLFLHVDCRWAALGIAIETIEGNLFPAGLLLLRDVLAGRRVDHIGALTGQALQVLATSTVERLVVA